MDQETGNWQDVLYRKTFDDEFRGLERRCAFDVNCGASDLEGMLRHLYTMEGADWLGRGEAQSVMLSATIAAYECFINKLKTNRGAE
ncbi:MAG: hypothetical protein LBC27_07880 [Spirochaetaceae bacterium]|jgi:hypothetical protein|nr:hypothetical protein [Spirochaetaceae bacterium]